MTLDSATVYRLEVPMKGSFGDAHHQDFRNMESVLVVLRGEGEIGIGTADATPGYSIQTHDDIQSTLVDELLPRTLDVNPTNPNRFHGAVGGIEDAPNALCALEMAYLDWYGKRHGRTVSELLAGDRRTRIPLNGWVGIDTPEAMAADAREWLSRGFDSLKIKLGGDPVADVARVDAVCDAVGDDVDVRADANTAYDVGTAIDVARELEQYPLVHLEQPVPEDDIEGLKRVTEASSTPIMADECIFTPQDAYEILRREAADRIKVKILRMGGVFNTRQVLDTAALAGISCVVGHGYGLAPATSAELALAATHTNVFGNLESVGQLKMVDEPFSRLQIESGGATLPAGHGLGIDLHEASLPEFADQSQTLEASS